MREDHPGTDPAPGAACGGPGARRLRGTRETRAERLRKGFRLAVAGTTALGLLLAPLAAPAAEPALAAPGSNATGVELSRDQVVAYFLLNCLRFGSWPAGADPQAHGGAVRIGWFGSEGLGASIEQVAAEARRRWLGTATLTLVRNPDERSLRECHLVFLGRDLSSDETAQRLALLRGLPILVVSDRAGFLELGGVAEIRIDRDRFTFGINLDELASRRIDLASKMKDLATALLKDGRREKNSRRREGP